MNELLKLARKRAFSTAPDAPLQGNVLICARLVWVVVATVSFTHFVLSLPALFTRLQTVCTETNCQTPSLTLANVRELESIGLSLEFCAIYFLIFSILLNLIWMVVGVVLFWRKSSDRVALSVSFMLVTFSGMAGNGANDLLTNSPVWYWLVSMLIYLSNSVFLIFYIFPDGKFIPRWSQVLLLWFGGMFVLLQVGLLFPESGIYSLYQLSDTVFITVLVFIGPFALYYRYRGISNSLQRQQTKWVVFGIVAAGIGFEGINIIFSLLEHPHVIIELVGLTVQVLALLLIPLSIGISILRYRLWDVDLLVNRTLVYATVTASITIFYILVVGGLGALFQAQGNLFISLLATGLIAFLFQPLRTRFQHYVNRVFYGESDDPYAVLSRLGQHLGTTVAPEALFSTVVETIAQALKLPYVAVTLMEGGKFQTISSFGIAPDNILRLPLVYNTEVLGELLLTTRNPGEQFTTADNRLLKDLGQQVGVAAQAVRLNRELQQSREKLVLEREEERKRLRRELHDSLGPTLSALTLLASNVSDLIPENPQAAITQVNELQTELRATVTSIRRLAYELRPPALDELGLLAAIQNNVEQLNTAKITEGVRPQIKLETPLQLPPLPAAIEVIAYRIIHEALANVIRHAIARNCVVRLSLSNVLQIEVIDDGLGLKADYKMGVGLLSMRERAEEVGGSCQIEAIEGSGTRVYVRLPLPKE